MFAAHPLVTAALIFFQNGAFYELGRSQQQQQLSSYESSPGEDEKVHYKIGDLGHVLSIFGKDVDTEEGECRYMAPEFLELEVRSKF